MSDNTANVEVARGTERNFGIVFSAVFLIIGLLPLFFSNQARWWALAVSAGFLLLAMVAPSTLRIPNLLWFKLGMLLGAIISPIAMTLVYIVAIVPTGIVARILGKDPLRRTIDRAADTYWIERTTPPESMTKQF